MKSELILIIKVFLYFLIVSLAGLSTIYNYQQIITFLLIPILLIIGILMNKVSFVSLKNNYVRYFLMIIILGLILVIVFNKNVAISFNNLTKLTGVLLTILFTVEILNYKKYNFTNSFLFAFVVAFLTIIFYAYNSIQNSSLLLSSSKIRGVFDLNANTYSYFSYFANIALFYLIQLTKKKIYIVLSIICLLLGVYISIVTASRSGLIFNLIIAVVYWLLIYGKLKTKLFLRFVLIVIIVYLANYYLLDIYTQSYLSIRMIARTNIEDERVVLLENAIDVFLENPWTGVGPGQFFIYSFNQNSFSHNSYAEIGANMGILGIIFLVLLLFKPLLKEINDLTKRRNNRALTKLNMLFFITFIFYNNFYVFYLTTYGMMFFFVIIMIQENYQSTGQKTIN